MQRLNIAPTTHRVTDHVPAVDQWFRTVGERMSVYSGASDPTVGEVPENQWILYYNTTLSELRMWSNIAGVMKKSAAFT